MSEHAEPLHAFLTDQFRQRVESGEWAEGTQLPSESALCAEFSVSRGTVRHALAALRQDGTVTGGQGRRPVVRSSVPPQPFSTFVSFTEWARSTGREPGQRTQEIARRPASEYVASQLHLEPGEQIVEVKRLRLLDGTPAMIERSSFVLDVGRLLFDADTDAGSIFAHLRGCSVDLDHATHIIDAVAADAEDARLLDIAEGAPLLRERRLTMDASDRPLEYSEDRYLPSLTTFIIENDSHHRAGLARVASIA